MHEDLMCLQGMDAHDRAATKARRQAQALRDDRGARVAAVGACEEALTRLEQSLSEERAAERSTHRDLEQVRTYRSRAQRALEQGLGDPEAAQRQLDQTSAQIDDLETALLERLEAQDALEVQKQAAKEALRAAHASLQELMATYADTLASHEQEADLQAGKLQDLASGLPSDLRVRYDGHRAKGRWAVASIREGACNACNQVVRQQHISDLRRGLLKRCLGCHRFLVLADG